MAAVEAQVQVRVVHAIDQTIAAEANALLERALTPVERDDRFDLATDVQPGDVIAALATQPDGSAPSADGSAPSADGSAPSADGSAPSADGSAPDGNTPDSEAPDREILVGYLGGTAERPRLRLDALVDDHRVDGAEMLTRLLTSLDSVIERSGADEVELWGRPARDWHAAVATANDFEPTRALRQMRCRLPVAIEPLPTRAFDPRRDLDQLRSVNNRAFAHHPDQGSQSIADLAATMAEPWFLPDGLRIHERDDQIVGFCWTKIHRPAAPGEPALGEIYVIGVDPDHHGQGLGAPMTAAGLAWLHDQGIDTGMLYVEAENGPAVRTYERLGFTTVRTDRAWARPIPRP